MPGSLSESAMIHALVQTTQQQPSCGSDHRSGSADNESRQRDSRQRYPNAIAGEILSRSPASDVAAWVRGAYAAIHWGPAVSPPDGHPVQALRNHSNLSRRLRMGRNLTPTIRTSFSLLLLVAA